MDVGALVLALEEGGVTPSDLDPAAPEDARANLETGEVRTADDVAVASDAGEISDGALAARVNAGPSFLVLFGCRRGREHSLCSAETKGLLRSEDMGLSKEGKLWLFFKSGDMHRPSCSCAPA